MENLDLRVCKNCQLFAQNPFNPKVGACMNSAQSWGYVQVRADQPFCDRAWFDEEDPFHRAAMCPRCHTWYEVGDFKADKHGDPMVCPECAGR